jgi:hypothetical protein
MKLFELVENQYKAKEFFSQDNAVKQVISRGKQVAAYIKKNCGDYLSQTKNGNAKLYRGFTNSNKSMAFTKKVRKDRQPLTSSSEEHDSFNVLIKLGKKKANRSNSLFSTGDEYLAADYGDEYVILPIGKFAYTWHKEYSDWYGSVDYHDILQKKRPKEKVADKKEKAAKLEKMQQEYELQYAKAEKAQETAHAYVRKFFKQYGAILNNKSFEPLKDSLDMMFHQYYDHGSMYPGKPSNPFPNVAKAKKPTIGSYWDTYTIQNTHLKRMFLHLQKADKAEKTKIRKGLMICRTKLKNIRKGEIWIELNPTFEEYKDKIEQQEYNERIKAGEFWKVGRDHISELDKDNPELKKFLKGLYGDDGTLTKGINSECEIMIACNTVLAIDPSFYDDVVLPLLNGKQPKLNAAHAQRLLQGHTAHRDDYD